MKKIFIIFILIFCICNVSFAKQTKYEIEGRKPTFDKIEKITDIYMKPHYLIKYNDKFYLVEIDFIQNKSFNLSKLNEKEGYDNIDVCKYKPYIIASLENKWYFINKKELKRENSPYIEAKNIKYLTKDYFAKKIDEKYAIVKYEYKEPKLKEKQVTDYIYDDIYNLFDGDIYNQNYLITEINNKKALINIQGKKFSTTKNEYDKIGDFALNNLDNENSNKKYFINAKKDGEKYIIKSKNSNKISIYSKVPNEAFKWYLTKNGVIFLKDNKYGFSTNEGKILLNPEFDLIYNPDYRETKNFLFVKKGEKYALYDIKNKKLGEFIYDKIYLDKDSTIKAENENKVDKYNKLKGESRNILDKTLEPIEKIADTIINVITFPIPIMYWANTNKWPHLVDISPNMPDIQNPKPYFE